MYRSETVKKSVSTCQKSGVDEVTMMHGWIIRYLYENREQDIFQKDIEQRFAVGRSTVTNLIQLMEKKGIRKKRIGKTGCQVKKSNPDRKRDCKPGIF